MRITVESRIEPTPRLLQAASLFDLEVGGFSKLTWDVDLPLTAQNWNVGLIVGPSGCGKSTVARRLFADKATNLWLHDLPTWPANQSVIDGFPEALGVKDVTALLAAVGFSSPPAWLRPYRVLSTGQQFRADLARLLAFTAGGPEDSAERPIALCDEFTSVIDRTVAKIGSHAVAKAVRARNLQFVAVTCHEDVIDWLQPDWVYRPDANSFAWRSLQRRPLVELEIRRCSARAWPLFAPHHYLSHSLASSATCFLAQAQLPSEPPRPAAFSAWMPFLGSGPPSRREHRTVVLPDFQGIGIGSAVSDAIASAFKAVGYLPRSTTTHPAFIAARKRNPNWKLLRPPGLRTGKTDIARGRRIQHSSTRATAGFIYTGPPMDLVPAQRLTQ